MKACVFSLTTQSKHGRLRLALAALLVSLLALQPARAIVINITGTFQFDNVGMPTPLPLGTNYQMVLTEFTYAGTISGFVDLPFISDFNSLTAGDMMNGDLIMDVTGDVTLRNVDPGGAFFDPGVDGGSGTFTRSFAGPNFLDQPGLMSPFDSTKDNGGILEWATNLFLQFNSLINLGTPLSGSGPDSTMLFTDRPISTGGFFPDPFNPGPGNLRGDVSGPFALDVLVNPSAVIGNVTGSINITQSIAYAGVVPIPPAVWLFVSGLVGLIGMARRKAT